VAPGRCWVSRAGHDAERVAQLPGVFGGEEALFAGNGARATRRVAQARSKCSKFSRIVGAGLQISSVRSPSKSSKSCTSSAWRSVGSAAAEIALDAFDGLGVE